MKYLVVLVLVLLVALLQERLPALPPGLAGEGFGSLLLDASFILVLPIAWMCYLAFARVHALRQIQSLLARRVIFLLAGTLVQTMLVAGILWGVSNVYLEQGLELGQAIVYTLSEELYKYLLIHSVIAWLLVQKKKPTESPDGRLPKDLLRKGFPSGKKTKLAMN